MMSWQGTDGPGRGIGSVPSVALAPARSGTGIESVMMDRVFGEPPHTQRVASGKERCAERCAETEKEGDRDGRGTEAETKGSEIEKEGQRPRERGENRTDPGREGHRN